MIYVVRQCLLQYIIYGFHLPVGPAHCQCAEGLSHVHLRCWGTDIHSQCKPCGSSYRIRGILEVNLLYACSKYKAWIPFELTRCILSQWVHVVYHHMMFLVHMMGLLHLKRFWFDVKSINLLHIFNTVYIKWCKDVSKVLVLNILKLNELLGRSYAIILYCVSLVFEFESPLCACTFQIHMEYLRITFVNRTLQSALFECKYGAWLWEWV